MIAFPDQRWRLPPDRFGYLALHNGRPRLRLWLAELVVQARQNGNKLGAIGRRRGLLQRVLEKSQVFDFSRVHRGLCS